MEVGLQFVAAAGMFQELALLPNLTMTHLMMLAAASVAAASVEKDEDAEMVVLVVS